MMRRRGPVGRPMVRPMAFRPPVIVNRRPVGGLLVPVAAGVGVGHHLGKKKEQQAQAQAQAQAQYQQAPQQEYQYEEAPQQINQQQGPIQPNQVMFDPNTGQYYQMQPVQQPQSGIPLQYTNQQATEQPPQMVQQQQVQYEVKQMPQQTGEVRYA